MRWSFCWGRTAPHILTFGKVFFCSFALPIIIWSSINQFFLFFIFLLFLGPSWSTYKIKFKRMWRRWCQSNYMFHLQGDALKHVTVMAIQNPPLLLLVTPLVQRYFLFSPCCNLILQKPLLKSFSLGGSVLTWTFYSLKYWFYNFMQILSQKCSLKSQCIYFIRTFKLIFLILQYFFFIIFFTLIAE